MWGNPPLPSEEGTISHILKNQYGNPPGRVPHVLWRSCKSWLDWLSESSDVHRWFTIPSVLSIFSQGKIVIKYLVFKFRINLTLLDPSTTLTDPCGREATQNYMKNEGPSILRKPLETIFLFLHARSPFRQLRSLPQENVSQRRMEYLNPNHRVKIHKSTELITSF